MSLLLRVHEFIEMQGEVCSCWEAVSCGPYEIHVAQPSLWHVLFMSYHSQGGVCNVYTRGTRSGKAAQIKMHCLCKYNVRCFPPRPQDLANSLLCLPVCLHPSVSMRLAPPVLLLMQFACDISRKNRHLAWKQYSLFISTTLFVFRISHSAKILNLLLSC